MALACDEQERVECVAGKKKILGASRRALQAGELGSGSHTVSQTIEKHGFWVPRSGRRDACQLAAATPIVAIDRAGFTLAVKATTGRFAKR
jgi:hypothetical protein